MKHPLRCIALAAVAGLPAMAGAAPLQVTTPVGFNSFGSSLSHDGSRLASYSASDLTGGNADRSFEIFLYERATGTRGR